MVDRSRHNGISAGVGELSDLSWEMKGSLGGGGNDSGAARHVLKRNKAALYLGVQM